ncbi:hypothetical protein SAMN04487851_11499 [Prevotella sp. tc2-28]|uniref:hypothetical protein n=1 Tax=Prevotella sp. tc2-28 TaxID=1761888 RepID=UPI00089674CE|nr:hypothetical protein [Prevotella sp. tc2-28]SEA80672.1 hypothetical protein SAMN04487851_11499 [Prevotella sp. tc2-28]
MAKTINLNDYKKMQLGDRQLYVDENNVVVAEKYLARYWLFYPAATSIKVVEEEDGTVRIIIDEPST